MPISHNCAMKRILFVVDDLGKGGAQNITLQLAIYLSNDHEVHVAVMNNKKNILSPPHPIIYHDLKIRPEIAFGKLWKPKSLSIVEQTTLRLLADLDFDIVILGFHNGFWLVDYFKAYKPNLNIWLWVHGDLLEVRPTSHWLKTLKEQLRYQRHKRTFMQLFANKNLITVNRELAQKYQPLIPTAHIKTIANGVDKDSLLASLSTDWRHTQKYWDMMFIGRLAKIKQVDHALRAFAQSGLTGRMAIIGDGNEKPALHRLCDSLSISNRVDFLGWVENPSHYMLQAKATVLSSYYEGSPMSAAESLTLEIPVVAYACSLGVIDLISPISECGLVEPQQIPALAQAMFDVVNKPYAFFAGSTNHLSMDNMAKQFCALTNV